MRVSRQAAGTRARARAPSSSARRVERRPRRAVAWRFDSRAQQVRARARLRAFRQGSALAVALTALLLMISGTGGTAQEQEGAAPEGLPPAAPSDPAEAIEQAAGTIEELVLGFYAFLPKILLAVLLLALVALAARVASTLLRRFLGEWEKTDAIAALVRIALFFGAIAVSLSVLAGDASALLGSIGLVGLALSWALQTPIESFTGWLLNSFRGYYRVGDRIEVGDVFGDVYRIDVLTTTVWEAGGPGKTVAGAQPTGAMITFPNWEVLRSNIVNYSREFPFVWDEVTVGITNESDLRYAARVFEDVARGVVGGGMTEAAARYQRLLQRARIAFDVEEEPRVFFSPADAWTSCTVRYLADARRRRRLGSDLLVALSEAAADPAHAGRIVPAYPRREILVRTDWRPSAGEGRDGRD